MEESSKKAPAPEEWLNFAIKQLQKRDKLNLDQGNEPYSCRVCNSENPDFDVNPFTSHKSNKIAVLTCKYCGDVTLFSPESMNLTSDTPASDN